MIECEVVEARVGETDAAIEHIRHLLSIPCLLSPACCASTRSGLRYGMIRASGSWQNLSGNNVAPLADGIGILRLGLASRAWARRGLRSTPGAASRSRDQAIDAVATRT